MRLRLIALALTLALPAAAQDGQFGQAKLGDAPGSAKGKAVEGQEAKAAVSDCRDGDEQRLRDAIQAAARRVDSCLEKENPDFARKIRSRFHKFKFHCGYSGGMEGGNTDARADGSADITMNLRARGVQYALSARTFHEMIHAVDPGNKLLLSPHTHAQAGYPDPVYACQLDCYPEGLSDDERKQVARLGRALEDEGQKLPLADAQCPPDFDCPTYDAYVGICRGGKVLATKAMRDADKKANAPTCFAQALLNACSSPCKGARKGSPVCQKACAFADAPDDAKGGMIPEFRALGGRLAEADAAEGQGLDGDDLALYQDASKRKLFAACR